MPKNELVALIIVILLTLGLVVNIPIEFTTQPGHIIASLAAVAFVLWLFYALLNPPIPFQRPTFNVVIRIVSTGLFLCYAYVALFWILGFSGINHYPRYRDITHLQNRQHEIAVKQEIEISGSLYAYRNRRIIAELPWGIRISTAVSDSELSRRWQRK
jgi:hypothetical protein